MIVLRWEFIKEHKKIRKQENRLSTKKAIKEKKKKENTLLTKSHQEKKEKNFFLGRESFFFFSYFLVFFYKIPILMSAYCHNTQCTFYDIEMTKGNKTNAPVGVTSQPFRKL